MLNGDKFALLWFPSFRGIAYLNVLKEMGKLPEVIVLMENEFFQQDKLNEEAKLFNYQAQYFDHTYTIEGFAKAFGITLIHTDAKSINDDVMINTLKTINIKNWLFTGGGILKQALFEQGKRFLHIHPGKIPEYRGSTCFYYSILAEMKLSASAFFLTPSLDQGKVLFDCNFSLNLTLTSKNRYFLDDILDPWIRSQTLKNLLQVNVSNRDIMNISETTKCESKTSEHIDRTFYVMHPLLRALTIKKINASYEMNKPEGIFIVE